MHFIRKHLGIAIIRHPQLSNIVKELYQIVFVILLIKVLFLFDTIKDNDGTASRFFNLPL
jgi:hypothetical protein